MWRFASGPAGSESHFISRLLPSSGLEPKSRIRTPTKEPRLAEKPHTPLLDTIKTPADLRALPREQLRQLADEVRTEMVDAVSVTGGHLGAGLGVVELTVALHAVFDTPHDRIIWDVGHQA